MDRIARRRVALLLPVALVGCDGLLAQGGGSLPSLNVDPDAVPPIEQSTTDVVTADFDLDGDLDLAWAGQAEDPARWPEGALVVTLNDGAGNFEAVDIGVPDVGPWTFIALADVDGDGSTDMVLSKPARSQAEIAVLVNDGTAHFTRVTVPEVTGDADGLTFGRAVPTDVDGDGDLDVFVPTFSTSDFSVDRADVLLLNDGRGSFSRDTEGRLPALPADNDWTISAAAGDLTGDGAPDLFLGLADRPPRLLVNDGRGFFADRSEDDGAGVATLPRDPMRAYRTELADLDGDGDLDVTVVNDASVAQPETLMGNYFFHNDGAGHFELSEMPLPTGRKDSRGLALADMNRDGLPDIVIGNSNDMVPHGGEALEVLLANGDGYAPLDGVPALDCSVFGVAVADYDGNGTNDVALAVALPGADGSFASLLMRSLR